MICLIIHFLSFSFLWAFDCQPCVNIFLIWCLVWQFCAWMHINHFYNGLESFYILHHIDCSWCIERKANFLFILIESSTFNCSNKYLFNSIFLRLMHYALLIYQKTLYMSFCCPYQCTFISNWPVSAPQHAYVDELWLPLLCLEKQKMNK